jgi:iron-regulated transporter 1
VKKGERLKWWKVYAMHFLFSWNSRTFENVSVSGFLSSY